MSTIRRTITSTGAATLLAALALAGCAEEEPAAPEPSATSSPSEDAAATDDTAATSAPEDQAETTDTAAQTEDAAATEAPDELELASTDDAFTVTVPGGWEDVTADVDEDTVLLAAKESERIDSFFTNVVVTEEEYVGNLTTAVESTAKELAGEDGEYEILDPAPVDGNEAPGYTLVREIQDSTVHQTQRWISHDGTLYVVTMSAVESQAEDASAALDDILASWSWSD